jgi:hypothetical protein
VIGVKHPGIHRKREPLALRFELALERIERAQRLAALIVQKDMQIVSTHIRAAHRERRA